MSLMLQEPPRIHRSAAGSRRARVRRRLFPQRVQASWQQKQRASVQTGTNAVSHDSNSVRDRYVHRVLAENRRQAPLVQQSITIVTRSAPSALSTSDVIFHAERARDHLARSRRFMRSLPEPGRRVHVSGIPRHATINIAPL